MNARSRTLLTIPAAAVLLAVTVSPASAVPMWARRYGAECTLCHSYPSLQLTGEGLDFLRRGHRMEGDASDKNVSDLISAHGEWSDTFEKGSPTAFPAPELHLHGGGALSTLFSGYVDAHLNEGFEALYLQVTKAIGDDAYITARQGKISPTIVRDYANGIMASASAPLIITDASLADNPFTPARDSYGFDVGGRWKAAFVQTGVVNGDESPGEVLVGNHKDIYATLELNPIEDDVSGVAVYYLRGGYDLADTTGAFAFDRYRRAAVFANLTRERYRIAGAYLHGTDDPVALPERSISGYYLQVDATRWTRLVPFARYDWVEVKPGDGTERVRAGTVGIACGLFSSDASGGRVVAEFSRRKESEETRSIGAVDILWAF